MLQSTNINNINHSACIVMSFGLHDEQYEKSIHLTHFLYIQQFNHKCKIYNTQILNIIQFPNNLFISTFLLFVPLQFENNKMMSLTDRCHCQVNLLTKQKIRLCESKFAVARNKHTLMSTYFSKLKLFAYY